MVGSAVVTRACDMAGWWWVGVAGLNRLPFGCPRSGVAISLCDSLHMALAASGGSVTADADDMIFERVHSRCACDAPRPAERV
jgi:hypothetical protein